MDVEFVAEGMTVLRDNKSDIRKRVEQIVDAIIDKGCGRCGTKGISFRMRQDAVEALFKLTASPRSSAYAKGYKTGYRTGREDARTPASPKPETVECPVCQGNWVNKRTCTACDGKGRIPCDTAER